MEDKKDKKNKVGRPLKFKTVQTLKTKIKEYFSSCYRIEWVDETRRHDVTGEWIKKDGIKQIFPVKKLIQHEEFTVTGLALFLDTTRETLIDYQNRDEFSDTIRAAKTRIENGYEKRLIKRGNPGDVFGLKNFGWKDKRETDLTSGGEKLPTPLLANLDEVQNSNSDKEDSQPEKED